MATLLKSAQRFVVKVGSSLVTKEHLANKDYAGIQKLAEAYVSKVKEVRAMR